MYVCSIKLVRAITYWRYTKADDSIESASKGFHETSSMCTEGNIQATTILEQQHLSFRRMSIFERLLIIRSSNHDTISSYFLWLIIWRWLKQHLEYNMSRFNYHSHNKVGTKWEMVLINLRFFFFCECFYERNRNFIQFFIFQKLVY